MKLKFGWLRDHSGHWRIDYDRDYGLMIELYWFYIDLEGC